MSPSNREHLKSQLEKRDLDRFNIKQWMDVLLSVLVEETMDFVSPGNLPKWAKDFPLLHVIMSLRAGDRDSSPVSGFAMYVDEKLGTRSRPLVAQALTLLVKQEYHNLKRSTYRSEREFVTTLNGLQLSNHLDGAISAELLEQMAFDRLFPHRVWAAINLVEKPFRDSVNPTFWDKLVKEVPKSPDLAHPIMMYYLNEFDPYRALQVLEHVDSISESNFQSIIIDHTFRALGEIKRFSNWKAKLKEISRVLPQWVHEEMKRYYIAGDLPQEVLRLLKYN